MEFSVCSFNVRGLGNKVKREQLFTWLKSSNHTFCLLQETHSGINTHKFWQQEWGHEAYFSGNSNNSEGIGILINPKVLSTQNKNLKNLYSLMTPHLYLMVHLNHFKH